jgi:hypothetical protein
MFRVLVHGMLSNIAKTQREILHSVSHSAFNVLHIMMQWWKHIIRIIYTFLKLHLPECIQPKQSLAPTPQNILHSTNIFEPTTDSLLLPGNCFTFFHDCRLQHHSIISVISSKTFKSFVTSCQQPDINASCTQYVLYGRRDISNKLIHHNDTLCIIQCMWLLW